MKNETAKREIESLDYYLQNHTDDYSEESHTAMMMAIKALEQEPCEDAISRQAVLDEMYKRKANGDAITAGFIKNMPPVNPQSKIGHWIFDEILDRHYYCSECKSMGVDYWDYCPNCGCRMIEPQERSDKE